MVRNIYLCVGNVAISTVVLVVVIYWTMVDSQACAGEVEVGMLLHFMYAPWPPRKEDKDFQQSET